MTTKRVWKEHLLWTIGALVLAASVILPQWLAPSSGLIFESPWYLLGLLLLPLVFYTSVRSVAGSGRMVFSMARIVAAQPRSWRTRLIPVGTAIKVLVVCLLVLAIARPKDSNEKSTSNVEGIDIVLTLDLSLSMAAEDMNPSRVEAAKEVVLDFIQRRKNDRIGAVVFGKEAYTLSPLTLDYSVLSKMISQLRLRVIDGEGTAIGNALGVSINRLRKSDAKSKTVILVTDGASGAGHITPQQAAEFANTMGIKVYTILVGRNDKRSEINPELLMEIADATGGAFFKAQDKGELVHSFHNILDALEKTRIEDQGVQYAEVFYLYLWPALALALLDMLLGLVVLRRIP